MWENVVEPGRPAGTIWRIRIVCWALQATDTHPEYTGLSKKMGGILNRYNLKSTGRIYTFGVLKYSEKFKVLDLL